MHQLETEIQRQADMLARHDGKLEQIDRQSALASAAVWGTEGQGGLLRSIDELRASVDRTRHWAIASVLAFVTGFGGTIVTLALTHR